MTSHLPIAPLEAALLFEDSLPRPLLRLDPDQVLAPLNAALAGLCPPFRELAPATGLHFGNDTLQIHIEAAPAPLDPTVFQAALSPPLLAAMQPDLVNAVAVHQAALHLQVSLADSFDLKLQDQALFDLCLRVTKIALTCLTEFAMPRAVYWGQSEQLFEGTAFVDLARDDFPLPLFVQPGFFQMMRQRGTQNATGVRALGSAHLIGKHVEFSDDPQPMAKSYRACLQFVAHCRAAGRVLRDGECFLPDADGDRVTVLHLPPSSTHPEGTVRLTRLENTHGRALFEAPPQAPARFAHSDPQEDWHPPVAATNSNRVLAAFVGLAIVCALAFAVSPGAIRIGALQPNLASTMNQIERELDRDFPDHPKAIGARPDTKQYPLPDHL